jgi:hypothetical protein
MSMFLRDELGLSLNDAFLHRIVGVEVTLKRGLIQPVGRFARSFGLFCIGPGDAKGPRKKVQEIRRLVLTHHRRDHKYLRQPAGCAFAPGTRTERCGALAGRYPYRARRQHEFAFQSAEHAARGDERGARRDVRGGIV